MKHPKELDDPDRQPMRPTLSLEEVQNINEGMTPLKSHLDRPDAETGPPPNWVTDGEKWLDEVWPQLMAGQESINEEWRNMDEEKLARKKQASADAWKKLIESLGNLGPSEEARTIHLPYSHDATDALIYSMGAVAKTEYRRHNRWYRRAWRWLAHWGRA